MPHHVDIHVGQRIRRRRWMTGMTQKDLGDIVGIKFQQVQKYEAASNRVSASRLYEISKALGVPVSFFFETITGTDSDQATIVENTADVESFPAELFNGKEATELLKSYYRWPKEQRRCLFELTKSMTKQAEQDNEPRAGLGKSRTTKLIDAEDDTPIDLGA